MTARRKAYDAALEASIGHARAWLDSVGDRPIAGSASVKQVRDTLGEALPEGPTDPDAVIRMLAEAVEPGLVASLSGRYFGFVVGGVHPAALAADWSARGTRTPGYRC